MRPTLWSVAIQAAGSAATVGAALLVASTMGLAAQGQFGLLRSWNDALVTMAVLGLPQGLLHLQYRESVAVVALRAWVLRYVAGLAVVLTVVLLAALALLAPPRWPLVGGIEPGTLAVLVAAVPLAAAHLLWRSLALRDVGVLWYAAITAAPALLIFAVLVPVSLSGSAAALVWVLFVAAALSAALSGLVVRRAVRRDAPGDASSHWSRATLWSVGVETGAQNVLTALSPAMVLSTVGWVGASLVQVGAVSLGLQVYQLFGVAAAYVAPMVYDRAASAAQPMLGADILAWLRAGATPQRMLLAAAVSVPALLLVSGVWPAGADSLAMLTWMAVAGVISMAVRLLVTLMLARGVFRPLTYQAVARLLMATGGTALLMQRWPATLAVPLTLAGTELLLLAWMLRVLRHGDARAGDASEPAAP